MFSIEITIYKRPDHWPIEFVAIIGIRGASAPDHVKRADSLEELIPRLSSIAVIDEQEAWTAINTTGRWVGTFEISAERYAAFAA